MPRRSTPCPPSSRGGDLPGDDERPDPAGHDGQHDDGLAQQTQQPPEPQGEQHAAEQAEEERHGAPAEAPRLAAAGEGRGGEDQGGDEHRREDEEDRSVIDHREHWRASLGGVVGRVFNPSFLAWAGEDGFGIPPTPNGTPNPPALPPAPTAPRPSPHP